MYFCPFDIKITVRPKIALKIVYYNVYIGFKEKCIKRNIAFKRRKIYIYQRPL